MFENLLGQDVAKQLSLDITSDALPPSLLFSGPPNSGKGTAALELARVLSCEKGSAAWNCPCPACAHHRALSHPDLLLLGPRAFTAEMTASAAAFLREPMPASRLLFLRSLSKLQARFNPVLWEGEESKLGKSASLSSSLDEDLEDFHSIDIADGEKLGKSVERILETAIKLEAEGVPDAIPIAQIRRASWWAHLAPTGNRKLLVIENADRMQEGARNALLKILEEPPATCILVLTTARKGAMMATILSRVRPYHFSARPLAVEQEVVRRVFRDPAASSSVAGLSAYLDSFLPVTDDILDPAAAFFVASALKSAGSSIPAKVVSGLAAGRLEGKGLPEPVAESSMAIAVVLEKGGKFQVRSLFTSFLSRILALISLSLRDETAGPTMASCVRSWGEAVRHAEVAVATYNQSPALALERLFFELSTAGRM